MTNATTTPRVTRWWWIRHAPVIDGAGRLYGQMDLDCDVTDTAQYDALARHLPQDAIWVVSNLSRTSKTATAILQAGLSGMPCITEPDLAEQDFGDWQGLSWPEMEDLDAIAYNNFWQNPTANAPPGGESFHAVIKRCTKVIERLTEHYSGHDIISVGHGGSIRAAIACALELDHTRALSFSIDNLSLTRLDHVDGGTLDGHGATWSIGGININVN
jgi:broad specificity phosphatase PhoE